MTPSLEVPPAQLAAACRVLQEWMLFVLFLVKLCSLSLLMSAVSSANTLNYLNLQHEVGGDFSIHWPELIAPAPGGSEAETSSPA